MLCELRVENLLLIERAELRLGEGLNVLTGETGAGKTVLRTRWTFCWAASRVRGSCARGVEAYVEGVFDLPRDLREELPTACPTTQKRSCSPAG
jgi:DNA repair protein RecN (Recombination protein N)